MDFSHESAALSRSSCSAISSFTSAHSDGGNSSCSNITNTASNSANVSSPLLYAGPGAASSTLQLSRHCVRSASEFEAAAADTRLLKLARLEPFSQHAALEPHIMNHNSSSSFMYLDNSNPSSISNNNSARSPFMLPAAAIAQAAFAARAQGSLPNLGPTRSLFTPEQWAEFTQQTYVFKHMAAGITPPPALLLPIINNVASLGRMGAGSIHLGNNAGGFYSGLRGNADLEPGRCRRTDGKKWRCAREVVPDQKYCERHMHRGRHRSRAKVISAISTNEPLNVSPNPAQSSPNAACTLKGNSNSIGLVINSSTPFSGVTAQSSSPGLSRESQRHVSLQSSGGLSAYEDSRSVANDNHVLLSDASGLRRIIENSPNLAELVKANSSTTTTAKLFNNLPTATTTKSQMNLESIVKAERAASQPAFPFNFLNSDRDADSLALRQFLGDWPRSAPRESGVPPILSWLDQLADEQNKRSRSDSDLSINTRLKQSPSPLSLSMTKFGGEEDMAAVDPSHCMGLSMAVGAEVSKDEGRYRSSNWVPITWDSPTIGGPLAEVLQSNNSNGNTNTNANSNAKGDQSCLNLIQESWDHHASPTKLESHSPSLASPTGVLQIKTAFGSYSDSSSSASSPRSALKLDPAAHHCDTLSQANLAN